MRTLISILAISVVISESLSKSIPVSWNTRVHQGGSVCRKPGGQCLDEHTLQICTGDLSPVVTVNCRLRRQGPYCNTDHNKCWRSAAEVRVGDRGRCPGQGLYPDPSDCQKYYDCSEARGAYEIHTCPENQYFRFKSLKCKPIEDRDDCNIIDCRRRWGRFVKLDDSKRLYALCDPNSVNNALFECPRKTEFNTSLQKCIVESSEESESSEEIDDDDTESQYLNTISSGTDNDKSGNRKNSINIKRTISNEQKKQNIPPNIDAEAVSGTGIVSNSAIKPVDSIISHSPTTESQDIHWDHTGKIESKQSVINEVIESNKNPQRENVNSVVDLISGKNNDNISSVNPHIESSVGSGEQNIGARIEDAAAIQNSNQQISNIKEVKVTNENVSEHGNANINIVQQLLNNTETHQVYGEVSNNSNNNQQTSAVDDIEQVVTIPQINSGIDTAVDTSTNKTESKKLNEKSLKEKVNSKVSTISDDDRQTSIVNGEEQEDTTAENHNHINENTSAVNSENEAGSQAIIENSAKQEANSEVSTVSNDDQQTSSVNSVNQAELEGVIENSVKQKVPGEVKNNSNDDQQISIANAVEQVTTNPEINREVGTELSVDKSVNKAVKSDIVTDNYTNQEVNGEISNISYDDQQNSPVNRVDQVTTILEINSDVDTEVSADNHVSKVNLETVTENTVNQEISGKESKITGNDQQTSIVNDVGQVELIPETTSNIDTESSTDASKVKYETVTDNSVNQEVHSESSNISNDDPQSSPVNSVDQVVIISEGDIDVGTDKPADINGNKEESEIVTENNVNQEINGDESKISDQQKSVTNDAEQIVTISETNGDVGSKSSADNSINNVESETGTENKVILNTNGPGSNIDWQNNSALDDVGQVVHTSEINSDKGTETSGENGVNKAEAEKVTENIAKQEGNGEVRNISNDDQQTSPANGIDQVTAVPENNGDVGMETSADNSVNNMEPAIITGNTVKQEVNSEVNKIADDDYETPVPSGVEQGTTNGENNSHIDAETSADNSAINVETQQVTEKNVKHEVNVESSNIENSNQEIDAENGAQQVTETVEIYNNVAAETSSNNNANNSELEAVTENPKINSEVSNISNNDKQTSPGNGKEQVVIISDDTPNEAGDTINENNNIAITETNNQILENQVANDETIISKDHESAAAVTDVEQVSGLLSDTIHIATTTDTTIIDVTNELESTNIAKHATELTVNSESPIIKDSVQDSNDESIISIDDESSSAATNVEQAIELPSDKIDVATDTIIINSTNALESTNIAENASEQIVNSQSPIIKDSVQDSVATDVNLRPGSTYRNDGVAENDLNQENISASSYNISNDSQSAASVVHAEPITDDKIQTSENKVADESEVLDENVAPTAQNNVTNELVSKEPETPVENIEPVELQPQTVNADVELIVENPYVETEENTVNTISPIATHASQQSEDNTVASETDDAKVSANTQLYEQTSENSVLSVETAEPQLDVEVNADDVNQQIENNGDGTQSSDAVTNDGSAALFP